MEARQLLSGTVASVAGGTMSMDPTFGQNGVVATPLVQHATQGVAIQPDGKIVIVGNDTDGNLDLTRLNPDGSLDSTFGANHLAPVMPQVNTANPEYALLQADGKILVGVTTQFPTEGAIGGGALVRFNADGTPDTTFGNNGRVAALSGEIDALAQQADGEIVVAGTRIDSPTSLESVIARFHVDGSVDSGFAQNGQATIVTPPSTFDSITRLFVAPDGKIVVGGFAENYATNRYTYSSFVLRFNSDGSTDSSFDASGIAPPGTAFTQIQDIAALPDGSLLFLQFNSYVVSLTRLNYDGSLDTAFGTGGTVSDIGRQTFMTGPYKLAIRPTGEILVEGLGTDSAYCGHFTPDGTLLQSETTPTWSQPDPEFPSWPVGKPTPTPMPATYIFGGQIDADGKLVAAGTGFAVRLNGDGYVWAGDPNFHWGPDPSVAPPAPTPLAAVSTPLPFIGPLQFPDPASVVPVAPLTPQARVAEDRAAIETAKLQSSAQLAALLDQLHRDQAAYRAAQRAASVSGPTVASARSNASQSPSPRELRLTVRQDRLAIKAARHQRANTLAAAKRKLRGDLSK
ncbi:MAG TPA: hypothetical protein VFC78_10885 [Tepidisphaeraceae bacterium]|nr:hypothetical protein [Tepidisphaeraceae bacterium]